MHVIFSHGKESGPAGVKITAMTEVAKKLDCETYSLDYRGMADPEQRAQKLISHLNQIEDEIILVGSSMGAYVSLRAAQSVQVSGLFLLAPAVYMPGYDHTEIAPINALTYVMHGWQDDIVPVENAIRFATDYHTELRIVDDDHVLRNSRELICTELGEFIRRV